MVKISKIADIYKAYQYNLENYNKLINDVEIMNKENENRIECIKKLTIKNDDLEDEIENLQEQIKLKDVELLSLRTLFNEIEYLKVTPIKKLKLDFKKKELDFEVKITILKDVLQESYTQNKILSQKLKDCEYDVGKFKKLNKENITKYVKLNDEYTKFKINYDIEIKKIKTNCDNESKILKNDNILLQNKILQLTNEYSEIKIKFDKINNELIEYDNISNNTTGNKDIFILKHKLDDITYKYHNLKNINKQLLKDIDYLKLFYSTNSDNNSNSNSDYDSNDNINKLSYTQVKEVSSRKLDKLLVELGQDYNDIVNLFHHEKKVLYNKLVGTKYKRMNELE